MGSIEHTCCAVLAVLAVFAACAASQSNEPAIPEINSSVLVFGPSDYVLTGNTSRCQEMVRNALTFNQSRLMFVPTAFWVNLNYTQLTSVNSQSEVSYYCLNQTAGNGTTPSTCEEATQAEIDLLTASLAACFKTAVDAGMDLALSPHLDDGLGLGGWRNGLVFDPLEQYGAWTYTDFWLYPLADALAQAITPATKVNFAMQGEMSATVFYYPESYTKLLTLLKERVLQGKPSYNPDNIQIGVSTNFNKLCGCVLQNLVDTYQYVADFPAAFAPLKSEFNMTAISALYNATDFIGISSYPSLTPDFTTEQLEEATEQFDFEVGQFGVNLTELNTVKGKPLYWNEYGLGGGSNQNGEVKATSAVVAAEDPFFGVFGSYSPANDPWVLYNLSEPSPVRDYMRYFYNQTFAYAAETGINPSFKYIVSGIFLWNDASWDIQAVYPESTTPQGSYRDPTLVPLFNQHNLLAMGSGAPVAASEGPSSTGGSGATAPGTTVLPSAPNQATSELATTSTG